MQLRRAPLPNTLIVALVPGKKLVDFPGVTTNSLTDGQVKVLRVRQKEKFRSITSSTLSIGTMWKFLISSLKLSYVELG